MNRPTLIGILNITPDSFSDGGRLGDAAIAHAKLLAEQGADMLDLGAESTRPGATLLSHVDEWARLQPVIIGIRRTRWGRSIALSLDTRHRETVQAAMAYDIAMVNNVGRADMTPIVADTACKLVVMHALTIPADPAVTLPGSDDPVATVMHWKEATLAAMHARGLRKEQLIFDPGIGFGKTAAQSLELVSRAEELVLSGGQWLFGHSRKSFLNLIEPREAHQRDDLTVAVSLQLAQAGVQYLRVHDIGGHIALFEDACT